jgi:hypothetical protein
MQRCFLLMVCFFLALAVGCQDGPKGDAEFKKEKVDPASNKPTNEVLQEAPPA